MKTTILTLFAIVLATVSFSQTFTDGELDYEVIDADLNQVELIGSELTGDVTIPATVTDSGIMYTVISIGAFAFKETGLTSIVIPDSVTSIGEEAFYKNNLTTVEIPDNVTSIGAFAFFDNSIESIEIPDSVNSIGNYAFYVNNLASVKISNSITSIGNGTFRNNSLSEIIIPDGVTSIGNFAFLSNSIESIEIPDSVTIIENSAFRDNSLTSIIIGNSVEIIDNSAFYENENLASVTSNAVIAPTLGDDVFSDISNDAILYVPTGTTQSYIDAGWEVYFSAIEEVEVSLSTEDFNNDFDQITAYPNPMLNELQLAGKTENIQAIKIFNVNGTLVKEILGSSLTNTIAVDYLSSGVYFLKLLGEQSSTTLKVIKQ